MYNLKFCTCAQKQTISVKLLSYQQMNALNWQRLANSKVPFPALTRYLCFQTMCGFCVSMHLGFFVYITCSPRVPLGIVIIPRALESKFPGCWRQTNKEGSEHANQLEAFESNPFLKAVLHAA